MPENASDLTNQHWQFLAAAHGLLKEQPNPYNQVDAPEAAKRMGLEMEDNKGEPGMKAYRTLVALVSNLAEKGLMSGSLPLSYQVRITQQGINELEKRNPSQA
jgi:hypothetical protein